MEHLTRSLERGTSRISNRSVAFARPWALLNVVTDLSRCWPQRPELASGPIDAI
jgi:hypothetical protein